MIDAVITWVDGEEASYQHKLQAYRQHEEIRLFPDAKSPTRFNQRGELYYCIQSILTFAPWIRNIFLITDQQTPSFWPNLQQGPHGHKLKLVNHQDIFYEYESFLPIFNSLAIETLLWRIPNLAEQFIYFNDDCFLIRPVKPQDFFQEDNFLVRGTLKKQSGMSWLTALLRKDPTRLVQKNPHRFLQEKTAKMANWERHFISLPHAPFPLKKSIFKDYFQRFPELLIHNIKFRFRHSHQFWPISLTYHLEAKRKHLKINQQLQTVTVNPSIHKSNKIKQKILHAEQNPHVAFFCVQSLDLAPYHFQEWILTWLQQKISRTSPKLENVHLNELSSTSSERD